MQHTLPKRQLITLGACVSVLTMSSFALAEAPADDAAPAGEFAAPVAERDVGGQAPAPTPANGPRLGGHIGTATALVTVSKNVRTIADQFTLLHPIGISLKYDRVTVDFETVVVNPIDPGGRTGLVIDPGVVYNFGPVAAGLRLAWQQSDSNFGLIPLVNKGILDIGETTWFVEAAFPTFYADAGVQTNLVLHSGIGF
jgi:hypothetical protein